MPKKIICCGNSVKEAHIKMNFSGKKMIVIPNGSDFKNFKKNEIERLKIRKQLNVKESVILIGSVGRFDPLKDHNNFIEACSLIKKQTKDVKFIIIGRDINTKNHALISILNKHKMSNNIILIDEMIKQILFSNGIFAFIHPARLSQCACRSYGKFFTLCLHRCRRQKLF